MHIKQSINKLLSFIFIVFFVFQSSFLKSQNGELDNIDCLYSKEIIIPFYNPQLKENKPTLNQTVFYGYNDQFSYWYKIIVKEQQNVKFKVSPINDSDSYAIQLYQYNEVDFCSKLFNQKVKPIKPSVYANNNDAFDLSEKTISVQKGNTYYLSVLNTSKNNCGHRFKLIVEKDTLLVNAVHIPCKRQLSSISVQIPTKKINKILDSLPKQTDVVIKEQPVNTVKSKETKITLNITCLTKDSQKKNKIDAKLTIIDKSTEEPIEVTRLKNGEYSFIIESGKQYKVKCSALGYQNSEKMVDYESLKNQAIQTFDIMMDALKEGQNFVLKSIYFYPNTYALKKESMNELQKLLSFMENNESFKIEVQGHTNGDNRIYKNDAYNHLGEEWNFKGSSKKLSQKRAETIKSFLEVNGITTNRVSATGFGGSKPIVKYPETMEEGQQNIRVEIAILKN